MIFLNIFPLVSRVVFSLGQGDGCRFLTLDDGDPIVARAKLTGFAGIFLDQLGRLGAERMFKNDMTYDARGENRRD
jgi:hypothetical protein